MTETNPNFERDRTEARERFSHLAADLSRLLGPMEAEKIFAASIIGVLGVEKSADFLGEVVIELDKADDTPAGPMRPPEMKN